MTKTQTPRASVESVRREVAAEESAMKKESDSSQGPSGLFRAGLQALALVIIIPSLLVFYLFREDLQGWTLPILVSLFLLVVLGCILLWKVLRGVRNVLAGLQRISSGQVEALRTRGDANQVGQMAEIIDALNHLTLEFGENAAQMEDLIQQFATLAELAEITAKIPDIKELLTLVLRRAMAATHARIGTVMLVRDDGAGLEIVASQGRGVEPPGPISLGDCLGKQVIETGEPMLVEDIEKAPATQRPNNWQRYHTSSFLIMPLKAKNATIGMVALTDKATGGTFNSQDQQFLSVLLGHVGYAVGNSRLLRQARRAAENLERTVRLREMQLEETQRKMIQTEKLSALGQLAGGVAHDFNNLLQAILGYAQLTSRSLDPESQAARDLEQIRKATERAAALTSQLLAFGRRQVLKPLNLDLNRVIDDVMKMLRHIIGEHIQIRLVQQSKGIVHADPQQIGQVLVNLCLNARDAMPDGGIITIETNDIELKGTMREKHPWVEPGRYVLLSVTDEGCGMDGETLPRVFEPFFTTKETGKGTGLGLSTVHGIVHQHHGVVDVNSKPGEGSTFNVFLPAVESASADLPMEIEEGIRGGTETILVAEDEEIVRTLMVRVLEEAGYRVLSASDGEEAVETFKANPGNVRLVLLDAVMPKMSGLEACNRIRAVCPSVAVLFCTGHRPDDTRESEVRNEGLELITKPHAREELLRKVREVLDAEHAPA